MVGAQVMVEATLPHARRLAAARTPHNGLALGTRASAQITALGARIPAPEMDSAVGGGVIAGREDRPRTELFFETLHCANSLA